MAKDHQDIYIFIAVIGAPSSTNGDQSSFRVRLMVGGVGAAPRAKVHTLNSDRIRTHSPEHA
jgi:hypothetical protein